MNSVQLLGNLAKDVETKKTSTGRTVSTFTVAATNTYIDQNGEAKEQRAFVNCVAWGKLGEALEGMSKGSRVFVEGRLNTRSYEAQDGSKRYVTEVIANFVGKSLSTGNSESNFDDFAGGNSKEEIPF